MRQLYQSVLNRSSAVMSVIRVIAVCVLALAICDLSNAKIYKQCDLVRELRNKFHLPESQVPTWTCIAYHESRYNTGITSKPNANGSRDHGLFQINDKYWCSPPGTGKGCGLSCAQVKTDDISKAVTCIKKIWAEWQRIHKNGFKAWSTYKFCDTPEKVNKFVKGC